MFHLIIKYNIEKSGVKRDRNDEPRISKGIARWTGNFTPPEGEY